MKSRILLIFILYFLFIGKPSLSQNIIHNHASSKNSEYSYSLKDTVLAAKYFEKAKTIYETLCSQNDYSFLFEKLISCENKIGWNLMRQRRTKEALNLMSKTLAVGKDKLGEDNLEVAQTYNIIGVLYWSEEDYDKSIEYYKKSLNIRIQILGDKNSLVGSSYNNMEIC